MGDTTNALQSMALETSYIEYSLHTTNAIYWAQARSLIIPCLFVSSRRTFQTPQTPPIDREHVDQLDTNSCKCSRRHWAFGGRVLPNNQHSVLCRTKCSVVARFHSWEIELYLQAERSNASISTYNPGLVLVSWSGTWLTQPEASLPFDIFLIARPCWQSHHLHHSIFKTITIQLVPLVFLLCFHLLITSAVCVTDSTVDSFLDPSPLTFEAWQFGSIAFHEALRPISLLHFTLEDFSFEHDSCKLQSQSERSVLIARHHFQTMLADLAKRSHPDSEESTQEDMECSKTNSARLCSCMENLNSIAHVRYSLSRPGQQLSRFVALVIGSLCSRPGTTDSAESSSQPECQDPQLQRCLHHSWTELVAAVTTASCTGHRVTEKPEAIVDRRAFCMTSNVTIGEILNKISTASSWQSMCNLHDSTHIWISRNTFAVAGVDYQQEKKGGIAVLR